MTKITVTDDDVTAAMMTFWDAERRDRCGENIGDRRKYIRAVCHALAERWSQPALDPAVTERLGKIIEESEE